MLKNVSVETRLLGLFTVMASTIVAQVSETKNPSCVRECGQRLSRNRQECYNAYSDCNRLFEPCKARETKCFEDALATEKACVADCEPRREPRPPNKRDNSPVDKQPGLHAQQVRASIRELEQAKHELQTAAHDFGGHRVEAIEAI